MAELLIRKAEEKDVDQIAFLEPLCFTDPWSRELIYEDVVTNKLSTYIVACLEDKIVGYAGFWVIMGECQINNVAVSPLVRGQRIGTLLLNTVISSTKAAGCTSYTLEVRESNTAARNLYKSAGFTEDTIRENYYSNPTENAVLMSLYLEEEK